MLCEGQPTNNSSRRPDLRLLRAEGTCIEGNLQDFRPQTGYEVCLLAVYWCIGRLVPSLIGCVLLVAPSREQQHLCPQFYSFMCACLMPARALGFSSSRKQATCTGYEEVADQRHISTKG